MGEELVLAPARLTKLIRVRRALRNIVQRQQNQLSVLVRRRWPLAGYFAPIQSFE